MRFDLIYGEFKYASDNLEKFTQNEIEDLLKRAKETDERMKSAFKIDAIRFHFRDYAYNLLTDAIENKKNIK